MLLKKNLESQTLSYVLGKLESIESILNILLENLDKQSALEVRVQNYSWISVKEAMPQDFGYDWVLVKSDVCGKGSVPDVAEYRNGGWYNKNDFNIENYCNVTHWKVIKDEFLLDD